MEKNTGVKLNIHAPETNHKATRILFVMLVVLGLLLIVLYITDGGRERTIQKYEALAAGIVATLPAQAYITQHYTEHQSWPQVDAVLDSFELTLPDSVKAVDIGTQGEISITYNEKVADDGKMHLKPLLTESGKLRWVCLGEGLPEEVLPQECSLMAS